MSNMTQEAVGGPTNAMKDKTSIVPQEDLNQTVLSLLKVACLDYGATFSIYTSKKGRTWVAFKTWGDPPYSSACEVPIGGDLHMLTQATIVAGASHLVKMNSKTVHIDSWRDLKQTVDAWGEVLLTFPWREHWEEELGSMLEAVEDAVGQNARPGPKDS